MAKITLTMDDGREVGFSGFPDNTTEELFNALAYYQLINNGKPMLLQNCADPRKGTFKTRFMNESYDTAACIYFVLPSSK